MLNQGSPSPVQQRPDIELQRTARALQAQFTDDSGRRVDYDRLRQSENFAHLRTAAGALRSFPLSQLTAREQRLAFWINLYNALILDAVVTLELRGKIRPWFFLRPAYNVGGSRFSADAIEHGVLRGNRPHPLFKLPLFPSGDPRAGAALEQLDPRIHLALNCGASSCPPIAVYEAERIDEQLDLACRSFLNGTGAQVDLEAGALHLSRIFDWYQDDFGGREGVLRFVSRYLQDESDGEAVRSGELRLAYLPYDWSLNRLR